MSRPVRFYAIKTDPEGPTEPWFLVGEEAEAPRGRGRRGRRTLEDVGLRRLDPTSLLFPLAPRWAVTADGARIQLLLDGQLFLEVPRDAVPAAWISAASEGLVWLVTGAALDLTAGDPAAAIRESLAAGLAFGGLALVTVDGPAPEA